MLTTLDSHIEEYYCQSAWYLPTCCAVCGGYPGGAHDMGCFCDLTAHGGANLRQSFSTLIVVWVAMDLLPLLRSVFDQQVF